MVGLVSLPFALLSFPLSFPPYYGLCVPLSFLPSACYRLLEYLQRKDGKEEKEERKEGWKGRKDTKEESTQGSKEERNNERKEGRNKGR